VGIRGGDGLGRRVARCRVRVLGWGLMGWGATDATHAEGAEGESGRAVEVFGGEGTP
jgi:hypothetical protein